MTGTNESYVAYRFTLKTKILANGEDPEQTVVYIAELDNATTLDAALVLTPDHPCFRLDTRLFSALCEAAKGPEGLQVHMKIMSEAHFGSGRQAVRIMDRHFAFTITALALTSTSAIIGLECKDMQTASTYLATFKLARAQMGVGEHKMPDSLGLELLRKALQKIPDLSPVFSANDAARNMHLDTSSCLSIWRSPAGGRETRGTEPAALSPPSEEDPHRAEREEEEGAIGTLTSNAETARRRGISNPSAERKEEVPSKVATKAAERARAKVKETTAPTMTRRRKSTARTARPRHTIPRIADPAERTKEKDSSPGTGKGATSSCRTRVASLIGHSSTSSIGILRRGLKSGTRRLPGTPQANSNLVQPPRQGAARHNRVEPG
jgi:hypothetical protein